MASGTTAWPERSRALYAGYASPALKARACDASSLSTRTSGSALPLQTIQSRLYEQSQPHRHPRLAGPAKTTIGWAQAEADTNRYNNRFPVLKPRRSILCQAMDRRVLNLLSSRFAVTAARRSNNMGH